MDLQTFAMGLWLSGYERADVSDALAIALELVQKDMVCGYVAAQRKLIVLAKDNPFPKLRGVNPEAGEILVETNQRLNGV